MIDLYRAKKYCKYDISLIENYDKAINSTERWVIHHKLELRDDYKNTVNDLILMNLYYNRPAEELIFLSNKEHTSLHFKNNKHSDTTKLKISISNKGKGHKQNINTKNKISKSLTGKYTSEFTKKFLEHYNYKLRTDNIKLFNKERVYYGRHNKCSWE